MLILFVVRFFLGALLLFFSFLPRTRWTVFRCRHFLLPVLCTVIFGILFYLSREQFLYWYSSDFGRSFVPPFNSNGIGYFLNFIIFRLWATFILSLFGSYLFWVCAAKLNQRYKDRFFYEDELYFGAAGIFLIGYPGFIYYLFLFLGIYLALQVVTYAYFWESKRITSYYLWLPLVLLLIAIQYFGGDKLPFLGILVL